MTRHILTLTGLLIGMSGWLGERALTDERESIAGSKPNIILIMPDDMGDIHEAGGIGQSYPDSCGDAPKKATNKKEQDREKAVELAKPAAQRAATTLEFTPRVAVNRTFKTIVNAPLLAADKVNDEVLDHELVLGVVINGEARAYPINMLTGPSREIINDTLGGRAIAATW